MNKDTLYTVLEIILGICVAIPVLILLWCIAIYAIQEIAKL
jgi:hypothetical protein